MAQFPRWAWIIIGSILALALTIGLTLGLVVGLNKSEDKRKKTPAAPPATPPAPTPAPSGGNTLTLGGAPNTTYTYRVRVNTPFPSATVQEICADPCGDTYAYCDITKISNYSDGCDEFVPDELNCDFDGCGVCDLSNPADDCANDISGYNQIVCLNNSFCPGQEGCTVDVGGSCTNSTQCCPDETCQQQADCQDGVCTLSKTSCDNCATYCADSFGQTNGFACCGTTCYKTDSEGCCNGQKYEKATEFCCPAPDPTTSITDWGSVSMGAAVDTVFPKSGAVSYCCATSGRQPYGGFSASSFETLPDPNDPTLDQINDAGSTGDTTHCTNPATPFCKNPPGQCQTDPTNCEAPLAKQCFVPPS